MKYFILFIITFIPSTFSVLCRLFDFLILYQTLQFMFFLIIFSQFSSYNFVIVFIVPVLIAFRIHSCKFINKLCPDQFNPLFSNFTIIRRTFCAFLILSCFVFLAILRYFISVELIYCLCIFIDIKNLFIAWYMLPK